MSSSRPVLMPRMASFSTPPDGPGQSPPTIERTPDPANAMRPTTISPRAQYSGGSQPRRRRQAPNTSSSAATTGVESPAGVGELLPPTPVAQLAEIQTQLESLSNQLRAIMSDPHRAHQQLQGGGNTVQRTSPTNADRAAAAGAQALSSSVNSSAPPPVNVDFGDSMRRESAGELPMIAVQTQSRSQSLGQVIPMSAVGTGGPTGIGGSRAVAASRPEVGIHNADNDDDGMHLLPSPSDGSPNVAGSPVTTTNSNRFASAANLQTTVSKAYSERDDAVSRDTESRRRKHYRAGTGPGAAGQLGTVSIIDTPTAHAGALPTGPSAQFGGMRSRRGSFTTPGALARVGSTLHRVASDDGSSRKQSNFVVASGVFSAHGPQGRRQSSEAPRLGRRVSSRADFPSTNRASARPSTTFGALSADEAECANHDGDGDDDEEEEEDTGDHSAPLGGSRKHHHDSKKNEGPVGYNEEHPFVSIMDIVYILNTIACSILAISGVNPRIDIENTSGLFEASICGFAFSTVFTACWIALRFFVQARKGDWEIIDRVPAIRRYYLRTWFAFDFLTFVPIEWCFVVWQWETFYIIGMRHVFRIARIVSLGTSGNPLRGSRIWYRFLSFCVAYALIIHILASGFGAVEDIKYLDSLYWAVLTVTSVGYGDIVPTSEWGKVYAMIAMITGVLLIASMTAFATSVLTTKDKLTEDTDERKSLMDAMLSYYDVPWEVRRDVIQMFPSVLEAQSENTFRNMSEAMPNFVARRVDAFARAKLLRTVPLFKNLTDTQMVLELSQLMTRRFVPVGEYIVNFGDVGTEMFFIIRGVVEVLAPSAEDPDDEIVVASLRGGEFFGEIALLQDVVRTASVQAVTLCELLVLDKDHVEREILEKLAGLVASEMKERRRTVARTANPSLAASPRGPGNDEIDGELVSRNDESADAALKPSSNTNTGGSAGSATKNDGFTNPFAEPPPERVSPTASQKQAEAVAAVPTPPRYSQSDEEDDEEDVDDEEPQPADTFVALH